MKKLVNDMTASHPARIQRRRAKGWRMPAGVIYVGRGSRFGNPYTVTAEKTGWTVIGPDGRRHGTWDHRDDAHRQAIILYATEVLPNLSITELAGHDLSCWCPAHLPCHADVLIAAANPPTHHLGMEQTTIGEHFWVRVHLGDHSWGCRLCPMVSPAPNAEAARERLAEHVARHHPDLIDRIGPETEVPT